jgi:hypothetical protein
VTVKLPSSGAIFLVLSEIVHSGATANVDREYANLSYVVGRGRPGARRVTPVFLCAAPPVQIRQSRILITLD